MALLRSVLFVPGNNMRMIAKIATLDADAVILDLEDSVPLFDKETARIFIRDSMKPIKSSGISVFVRVNALSTELTKEDLKFVVVKDLDGIMLPKTETRVDIVKIKRMLRKTEKKIGIEQRNFKIIPLIETSKGVMNVHSIASASSRIVAIAFGAGDYYRDIGRDISSISSEQNELLYARSKIVNDSRAAGIPAIDTPYMGLLTDKKGLERETKRALQLGFKGKLLIHPNQIKITNEIFSPSENEVEYAKQLVAAFEEARNKGLGATSFEGKMIDKMHYQQAKELLDFAKIIAGKEKKRQERSVSLFEFFK